MPVEGQETEEKIDEAREKSAEQKPFLSEEEKGSMVFEIKKNMGNIPVSKELLRDIERLYTGKSNSIDYVDMIKRRIAEEKNMVYGVINGLKNVEEMLDKINTKKF